MVKKSYNKIKEEFEAIKWVIRILKRKDKGQH